MTYNPQSGTNWPAGLNTGTSFEGIIAAFNDLRVERGLGAKEYQDNFGGIISAVRDLIAVHNVHSAEFPPNWELQTNLAGEITGASFSYTPSDGSLWFDKRSGRLMIWDTDAYYQTNGADGLTAVGTNQPTREVEGALWFNTQNQTLYIYYAGTWNVALVSGVQGTADLPLNSATVTYYGTVNPLLVNVSQFTPATSADRNQSVLNRWVIQAVRELDAAIETKDAVAIAPAAASAPSSPTEGDLYFNTGDLNLYVYNTITGTAAWRHAINPTNFSDDRLKEKDGQLTGSLDKLNQITAFFYYENDVAKKLGFRNNERQLGLSAQEIKKVIPEVVTIAAFDRELDSKTGKFKSRSKKKYLSVDYEKLSAFTIEALKELNTKVDTKAYYTDIEAHMQLVDDKLIQLQSNFQASVNHLKHSIGNNTSYATTSDLEETCAWVEKLSDKLEQIDKKKVDLSGLATTDELSESIAETRELLINLHKANEVYTDQRVDLVKAALPDFDQIATLSEVESSIKEVKDNIEKANYVSDKGGDIAGRFQIKNADIELPSLDFSASASDSQKAFRFKSNAAEESTVDFGTTDYFWEYAWEFSEKEDFCWKGAEGKVFSIDNNGAACTKLLIGQFSDNNEDGRVVSNSIDVGERLSKYQSAFEAIREALAVSSDFEAFREMAVDATKDI